MIATHNWVNIPSKEIFRIWDKYKYIYFIEVRCPYCEDLTYIWFQTKDNRLHLRCSCEIPEDPTPKLIQVKLIS